MHILIGVSILIAMAIALGFMTVPYPHGQKRKRSDYISYIVIWPFLCFISLYTKSTSADESIRKFWSVVIWAILGLVGISFLSDLAFGWNLLVLAGGTIVLLIIDCLLFIIRAGMHD